MKKNVLFSLILALLLISCKSQEVVTEKQTDYSSYFEKQGQKTDSLFAELKLQQQKTTEKLSNLKVENTTTYYTLPDSAGKQYPVYVSTTTANKDEKVNESMFAELITEMSRMKEVIDSLTNAVNAAMKQKEEVTELSWWDLHKSGIYSVIAILIIGFIGYLILKHKGKI